jgi:hypothetical protein
MRAAELGPDATDYAKYLSGVDDRHVVRCQHIAARDVFINVYQNVLPQGSGVYWFSLPDGDVFYIGKADSFTRIWDHTFAASYIEDNVRGFPTCVFCKHQGLSNQQREDIRRGHFHIDYLTVNPGALAPVFEIHLQAVYFLREGGRLPACNAKFG